MISVDYARTMARYNRWQNQSIFGAAATLDDAQRREYRGAFFGSLQGTLSHLFWGDSIWLSRFSDWPRPDCAIQDSAAFRADWDQLVAARQALDEAIVRWADQLTPAWLDQPLRWYSGAAQREMEQPRWSLVTHFFNHQTHHRGQAHSLLTQLGAKPGDTDLILMPGQP